MRASLYAVAAFALFTGSIRAQPATAPTSAAMTTDTPAKTTGGATFIVPRQWSLETRPQIVIVSPPEADTRIAIVDVAGATDASAAAAAAWRIYRPEAHRPLKLVTTAPAREGWDERHAVSYETSPNEHVDVFASTLRSGSHWTVAILDGTEATVEKRGAAVGTILESLRPAGYRRESFRGRVAHSLDPARVDSMKAFVRTAMQEVGVPGVAFALVDHGKVVYEGGLGVRELGKPTPVDEHTLFMIASNTKGMSTLLLAEMVDRGKVRWDQPVTEVYPTFRLGSTETTRHVLMRHLVCACTGLPRKDFDWIFGTRHNTPASATFTELAATEPTSAFGEVFQYNNLMASAAGYIAGRLAYPDLEIGVAYDSAMQTMIFRPLGMNETTFDVARALAGNHASPHGHNFDGQPSLGEFDFNYSIVPYRPAGGAWSSSHDLIKYVEDELRLGELPDGHRLVSEKNLLARREPSVPIGENGYYGMGLEVDSTWGVRVVHHGGSMAGYKSDIMLIPGANVGAVILTNSDEGGILLRPFMRRWLEILYDGKPEAAGDVAAAAERLQAAIAKERQRLVIPADPASAGELASHYTNADLGEITVRHDAANVVFDFGLWRSPVASRKNDDGTISFITIGPVTKGFEFVVAQHGTTRTLVTRDGQHEYVYTEAPTS